MNSNLILKRLYKNYSKKFLRKIFAAGIFSIIVAGSTSAIAWLLDPAIKKIFIEKDETLILLIPAFIVVTFAAKGISLYLAKSTMIGVGEEIKKLLPKICFSFDWLLFDPILFFLTKLSLDQNFFLPKKI